MHKLNLPSFNFTTKTTETNKTLILDIVRKKYVSLTPEEWVRQNFVRYLIDFKNFPKGLIAIEYTVNISHNKQRSDIVCFDRKGKAILIVECKAPNVNITKEVFEQAARYNMNLKTDFLILTNGINHYCCKIDYNLNKVNYLNEIPDYNVLNQI